MDIEMTEQSFLYEDDKDQVTEFTSAIFSEFYSVLTQADNDSNDILERLKEAVENTVTGLRMLLDTVHRGKSQIRKFLPQLCMERDIYKLLLDIFKLRQEFESSLVTSSVLLNLLRTNREAQILYALLKWTEFRALDEPQGLAACLNKLKTTNFDKVISDLRTWTGTQDVDLIFSDQNPLRPQFEETASTLYSFVLAFLRVGRPKEAVHLAERAACHTIAALADSRAALNEVDMGTREPLDPDYGFADCRMAMKAVARDVIQSHQGKPTDLQQLFWAVLAADLPTLWTRATNTDDKLWALANCAVEELFDDALKEEQTQQFLRRDPVPTTVKEVFDELLKTQPDPFFEMVAAVAQLDPQALSAHLRKRLICAPEINAARFHAHLCLIFEMLQVPLDADVVDRALLAYVDALVSLRAHNQAPFYLAYTRNKKSGYEKLMDVMQSVENEEERKNILADCLQYNFDAYQLCVDIYGVFKDGFDLDAEDGNVDQQILHLKNNWSWLTYSTDTICDALLEANYLLRRLLAKNRLAQATEFMNSVVGADLLDKVNSVQAAGTELTGPEAQAEVAMVERGKNEFQGFVNYFTASNSYAHWSSHMDQPVPTIPQPIPDDKWARLDLRKRAEYEMAVQEARERQRRHENVTQQLRKNAETLITQVLVALDQWTGPGEVRVDANDPQSVQAEDQRNQDMTAIRQVYVYTLILNLIDMYRRSQDDMAVLNVSKLVADDRHEIYKHLSKKNLRSILKSVTKSGAALLDTR